MRERSEGMTRHDGKRRTGGAGGLKYERVKGVATKYTGKRKHQW